MFRIIPFSILFVLCILTSAAGFKVEQLCDGICYHHFGDGVFATSRLQWFNGNAEVAETWSFSNLSAPDKILWSHADRRKVYDEGDHLIYSDKQITLFYKPHSQHLSAFDTQTGTPLWNKAWKGDRPQKIAQVFYGVDRYLAISSLMNDPSFELTTVQDFFADYNPSPVGQISLFDIRSGTEALTIETRHEVSAVTGVNGRKGSHTPLSTNPPLVINDVFMVASGFHIEAIHPSKGILWGRTFSGMKPEGSSSEFGTMSLVDLGRNRLLVSSWQAVGLDARVLNAKNGDDMTTLIGDRFYVDETQVYGLTSNALVAYSLDTLERKWLSPGIENVVGIVPMKDRLLVAFSSGTIGVFDAATGSKISNWDPPFARPNWSLRYHPSIHKLSETQFAFAIEQAASAHLPRYYPVAMIVSGCNTSFQ